jgi:Domain of unknown function (DUF1918)
VHASVGDRIVICGHRVGEPERDCEVIEVRGENEGPPYLVRWEDNGHEGLFFPGSDASVQHFEHHDAKAESGGKS